MSLRHRRTVGVQPFGDDASRVDTLRRSGYTGDQDQRNSCRKSLSGIRTPVYFCQR